LLIPALLALAGCGSSAALPTTLTTATSTAPLISETFIGALNANGGATKSFSTTTTGTGTVTATLTSVDPDPTIVIGLSLGNWNGTSCAWAVANDSAVVGTAVSGTVSGPSALCARVYDNGHIGATPLNFVVTISHPQ
jgi:hypothetical protein